MPHHTTLVQRCRATNSLLADDLQREFSRLENDRAAAAYEIEQLVAILAATADQLEEADRAFCTDREESYPGDGPTLAAARAAIAKFKV